MECYECRHRDYVRDNTDKAHGLCVHVESKRFLKPVFWERACKYFAPDTDDEEE